MLDTWFLVRQSLLKTCASLKHPSFGGVRDFWAVLSNRRKSLTALILRMGCCRACKY